jgi:ketosteroid isomerase-like protein
MNTNEKVVEQFYSAFQKLDYRTMQACYAETASFTDPAFGRLTGNDIGAMWEMLCKNAKNFSLRFTPPYSTDEHTVICFWVAVYTFSKTGKHVENRIQATLKIQDGKIIEHVDQFDFWRWSRQALGLSGMLLGWSGFLRRKVTANARLGLEKFKASQNKR